MDFSVRSDGHPGLVEFDQVRGIDETRFSNPLRQDEKGRSSAELVQYRKGKGYVRFVSVVERDENPSVLPFAISSQANDIRELFGGYPVGTLFVRHIRRRFSNTVKIQNDLSQIRPHDD